jgi:hypothetical protein
LCAALPENWTGLRAQDAPERMEFEARHEDAIAGGLTFELTGPRRHGALARLATM